MKTNRLFMLFAATAISAAVSCNKQEFNPEIKPAVCFTASAELPKTKTSIDFDQESGKGTVTWNAGDEVAFYYHVNKESHENDTDYPYTSALSEGGTNVKFTIENASEAFIDAFIRNNKTDNGRNLYAVYPRSVGSNYYKDAEHTGLDFTIPSDQVGKFETASIAVAKWSTANPTNLGFFNLCGLLKINITDENVKKITVKSDTDIAGQVYVTFKDGETSVDYPVIYKTGEVTKEITVEVNNVGEYYVAVRPTTINNLYVEYRGTDNSLIGGSNARELIVERAKIYSLPSLKENTDKLFVKVDGTGDGSSWDNAMNMAGLEAYMEKETAEFKKVYLAAGTYVHTSAFYNMPVGFELYGGFPATAKGYDLTGRDLKTNATIIDGGWDGTSTDTNNRLFVIQKGTWVFDGLTFQNVRYSGKASGSAIQVIESDGVTISNCTFKNCVNANSSYYGGVIRVDSGNTVDLESCTFEQNNAQLGGAVYCAGNLNAVNCVFNKNSAVKSGGALYAVDDAVIKMDKCQFTQNAAEGTSDANGGGAFYVKDNVKLYFNGCDFVKNTDMSNASHIFAKSETNHVAINNSVFRGPFDAKTKAGYGALLKLNGYAVVVNTTIYGRIKELGGISFGTMAEGGCTIVNDIIINTNSEHGSLAFHTVEAKVQVYNTIYSNHSETGTINFTDCVSGASCKTNFPAESSLWDDQGTAFYNEYGRKYYAYAWDGTTGLGEVKMTSLAAIKELISGTANVGADFLSWLGSNELKVNGVEALAVDIRGVARDKDKMWPGSYQAMVQNSAPEADAENFNIK